MQWHRQRVGMVDRFKKFAIYPLLQDGGPEDVLERVLVDLETSCMKGADIHISHTIPRNKKAVYSSASM